MSASRKISIASSTLSASSTDRSTRTRPAASSDTGRRCPFSPRSPDSHPIPMRLYARCLVAVLFVTAAGTATAATKPKPWQWSSTKAVTRLKAATPLAPADVGNAILEASCRGTGKSVAGRYSRFTCDTRWGGPNGSYASTLTLRVLAIGSGKLCVITTIGAGGDPVAVPYTAGTQGTHIRPERACP